MRTLAVALVLLVVMVMGLPTQSQAILRVGTGLTISGAIGDGLQRTDQGSVNMLSTGSWVVGQRWQLLIDLEQGSGEEMPSSLYGSWVIKGHEGDPQVYLGLGASVLWKETGTTAAPGGQLGFLLPIDEDTYANLGFRCYWVNRDSWFLALTDKVSFNW